MPRLNSEKGGFALGPIVRYNASFKYTAAGNLVDTIRDGASKCIESVTRVSAGLYEITFAKGVQLPTRLITSVVWVNSGAIPTKIMQGQVDESTYNTTTRKMRIQLVQVGSTAAGAYVQPAAADPDNLSRINFELVGSISGFAGTDPA